jgi:uncharacterized protein
VIDFDLLFAHVIAQFPGAPDSVHGAQHWRRVARNGRHLAGRTGADLVVVRLFALFHDSRREHDGPDLVHGDQGAELAMQWRGVVYELDDTRMDLLVTACRGHTRERHHADPTIGTCWDADRLDLGRVGIVPSPGYMSTGFGRELAARGDLDAWLDDQPPGFDHL